MRITTILTFWSLILLILPIHALDLNDTTSQEKIVIATDGLYPPFEFLNEEGKLDGFETQLLRRSCEIANIQCEFKYLNESGEHLQFGVLIDGVVERKWDATFGDMGITKDRINKGLKFIQSHIPAKFLLGKLANSITTIPDDLSGKTVGVEKNTKFAEYAMFLNDELKKKSLQEMTIIEYENSNDIKKALLSGEIEFNPAPEGFIAETVNNVDFSEFGIASPELTSNFGGQVLGDRGAGFAFHEDSKIQYKIAAAMQELLYTCEYAKIYSQYMGDLNVTNLYLPIHCIDKK